jgi:tetratricopeptide (TPR) repeat protein
LQKLPYCKGAAMKPPKDRLSWDISWRVIVGYVGLIIIILGIIVITFTTDFLETSKEDQIPPLAWLLLAGVSIIAIIITISKLIKVLDAIQDNSTKLERLIDALGKNRSVLEQIDQSSRLSDSAKAMILRDSDRQFVREAVLSKIQQEDLDTAYEIIDDLANRTGYKELAIQLRAEADKHHGATDQERIEKIIAQIEKLFESYQWVKANIEIEKLIHTYPDSEEAKSLRRKLLIKREERKKVLLNAWDDAVNRRATDRSLEILKELDLYLTPQEAVTLQEAARDVFKDKLHNLGVQFSLAISGEQWDKALEIGRQIIHDFPNSRMSEEIREKMDVLKQKVELQNR